MRPILLLRIYYLLCIVCFVNVFGGLVGCGVDVAQWSVVSQPGWIGDNGCSLMLLSACYISNNTFPQSSILPLLFSSLPHFHMTATPRSQLRPFPLPQRPQ